MKTVEHASRITETFRLPVSSQGQITLPKTIRERLGIKVGSSDRVVINVDDKGTISIKQVETVDSLFGILAHVVADVKPADIDELREVIQNERFRELGYTQKGD